MMGIITIVSIYFVVMHVQMNQSLKQSLPSDINYLLILGSCLKSDQVTLTLRSRLEKGAQLLKQYPNLMVVVTGGKGSEMLPAEAQLMKRVLVEEYEIDEKRIIVED